MCQSSGRRRLHSTLKATKFRGCETRMRQNETKCCSFVTYIHLKTVNRLVTGETIMIRCEGASSEGSVVHKRDGEIHHFMNT